MKYANFGTVSHGTMRLKDLLPDFASELEYHVRNNKEQRKLDSAQFAVFDDLIKEAKKIDADDEQAPDVLDELFTALDYFAPPSAYFGAHPGDGSDYGFWLPEGFDQDFDGLKVSDTSEIPADYVGEALHVNDHGNITLYACDGKDCKEVWAVV